MEDQKELPDLLDELEQSAYEMLAAIQLYKLAKGWKIPGKKGEENEI